MQSCEIATCLFAMKNVFKPALLFYRSCHSDRKSAQNKVDDIKR